MQRKASANEQSQENKSLTGEKKFYKSDFKQTGISMPGTKTHSKKK